MTISSPRSGGLCGILCHGLRMIMRKVVQPKSRREELVNDAICEHPKDLANT